MIKKDASITVFSSTCKANKNRIAPMPVLFLPPVQWKSRGTLFSFSNNLKKCFRLVIALSSVMNARFIIKGLKSILFVRKLQGIA